MNSAIFRQESLKWNKLGFTKAARIITVISALGALSLLTGCKETAVPITRGNAGSGNNSTTTVASGSTTKDSGGSGGSLTGGGSSAAGGDGSGSSGGIGSSGGGSLPAIPGGGDSGGHGGGNSDPILPGGNDPGNPTPTSVPEPGACALLASTTFLGLSLLRKRVRRG